MPTEIIVNDKEKLQKANNYFYERTKKVYIDRCNNAQRIETFEKYLSYRYRDNCYFYSMFALMGLKPSDFLVRGTIDYCYEHGWVEFEFKSEEYVFDSMIKGVVLKQEWYDSYNPKIWYKKTQKEILDEYLTDTYAIKIKDGFWQVKGMNCITGDNPTLEDYRRLDKFLDDRNTGYVFNAIYLSRIQISSFSGEVERFIAYSEPSG